MHEIARREYGVTVSYSFVKRTLQAAGLVKKQRARSRHRRRREPRTCFGELLHLDGSRPPWLALRPDERETLIAIPDHATNQVLHAALYGSESSHAVMTGLATVFWRVEVLKVALPYHESDHVLGIAYNVLCGGTCLQDIEQRRQDEVYLDALGAQLIPNPTTAGDFCRRFDEATIEALQIAINETRLRMWRAQPPAFLEEAIPRRMARWRRPPDSARKAWTSPITAFGAITCWWCRWRTRRSRCSS